MRAFECVRLGVVVLNECGRVGLIQTRGHTRLAFSACCQYDFTIAAVTTLAAIFTL